MIRKEVWNIWILISEKKKAKTGLLNSLWDTYSAMANCYSGMILLGVAENEDGSFSTTGLKNAEKLQKDFWNTINNSQKVSINLLTDNDITSYDINGDVILAIRIPKANREDRPVYINDNIFSGNKHSIKTVKHKQRIVDFLKKEECQKAADIAEYIGLSSARKS